MGDRPSEEISKPFKKFLFVSTRVSQMTPALYPLLHELKLKKLFLKWLQDGIFAYPNPI
jgi:hypothetical protein